MQSESALRQAVEEQLDLILKIEEERKLLKKQNKMLKEEHQKMMAMLKKYTREQTDQSTNTQTQPTPQTSKPILLNQYVQVDLQTSQVNTSKLSSAQDLLKQLNISSQNLCSRCEQQLINTNYEQKQVRREQKKGGNQQVSNQIVKMAKEIAALKKQIKDCDAKSKLKDKELKELKKCLQVKSQAVEKSRRQFNQLSQVLNGDKYKSVRGLESENKQLRLRNGMLEEQAKINNQIKAALAQITCEYEEYRADRQSRIARLITQLKEKDSKCDQLTRQLEKSYSLQ